MSDHGTITSLRMLDVRFPTSREHDGSDAMNVDPDYSAAYVIIGTDRGDGVEGHGLTFTIGRGNEVVVAGINAIRPLLVGHREPAVLAVQVDSRQALHVQDEGAMYADETRRVELGFQLAHGLLLSQTLAGGSERQVIVLRLDEVDALERQHVYAAFVPDQDALQRAAWWSRGSR